MRKFRKSKILISIASIISWLLSAGATITGKVTDKSNSDPLIGANVIVEGTSLGSATDLDGRYSIPDVPYGTYTVMANYIGYEIQTSVITLTQNELLPVLDFSLVPQAIRVEGAQVTGIRRQDKVTKAPSSVEIISTRDIRRQNTTNIGSYLGGMKGVDFTASGINNYSVSIRGFNSSFSSRLLTLTDGRVANIPALRVINYATIPQSTQDVEKIEVVLGPATALYGANAHSGVINITSKSPRDSEGLNFNISGSSDERQLRQVAGRWAKKFGTFSMKLSGSYLHAYEWEYMSEREYKAHSYPWVGFPERKIDGKDNNPWKSGIPSTGGTIANARWGVNNNGEILIIGDGEANHGDLDGDGIAGEDWFNGIDDDHDGKVDEDYFWADGIDNAEPFDDLDENGVYDLGEPFEDWDSNGEWSGANGLPPDENIDLSSDIWYDGYDNDGIGGVDDTNERISNSNLEYPAWANNIEAQDIILYNGKISPTYHGDPNPWYDPSGVDNHVRGNYEYDEDKFTVLFDNYIFDYGQDRIPGDPFDDLAGDNQLQVGEPLNIFTHTFGNAQDVGLDGIPNTDDEGEGDGIWQPGDGWVDLNGNGIVDVPISGSYNDTYLFNPNNWNDVWPPPNGIWNEGEPIYDFGQDGLPGTGDPGEGNGLFATDIGESDGIYDTGDGCFGCENDYMDDFQVVRDTDGDGDDDYPDFEVDNRKIEMRMDYNPNPDLSITFQGGYSYTKTQQVTGIGRYLADGWEYKFFQMRALYKNWFVQTYTNTSYSGKTRGYNLGDHIIDHSSNFAVQIQNNLDLRKNMSFPTELIWGVDLFQTMPQTFGTILNDGPNGYDNDGDRFLMRSDGVDNDGDGLIDESDEGIDEPDEFDNVNASELGVYYQSSTILTTSKRWKLITAARVDSHDQLKEEGLLFGPKLGLIFEPNERNMWRLTYGKAFNTPTTTTLFTDIYIGKSQIFDIYSRGNKDGTPYARVSQDYPVQKPGYYGCYNPGTGTICPDSPSYDPAYGYKQIGLMGAGYFDSYGDRVTGAPFFFNITDESAPVDWIPLDTLRYLIFVPEVNGDGVLYTPEESYHLPDIDPLRSENIQTFEIGYKGFLGDRTFFTFDYYVSYYQNFFSPATIITPTVVKRYNSDGTEASIENNTVIGILPINDRGSNPPYGTAWNGLDDDGDWAPWADEFGWGATPDAGEWGFVEYITDGIDTLGYNIYHPWEVFSVGTNFKPEYDFPAQFWKAVGVDEYQKLIGLGEAELVQTSVIGPDGNPLMGPGRASSPPHIILSSLNYGEVWIQGFDMSFTHFLTPSVTLNGNFSWYNSTEFYNDLTKKNDPINAPKFKWTVGAKWESKFGSLAGSLRHVDRFPWSDGLWAGTIGPYNIINIHYSYEFNKHVTVNISGLNLLDDYHRELVGGAKMGQQFVFKLATSL